MWGEGMHATTAAKWQQRSILAQASMSHRHKPPILQPRRPPCQQAAAPQHQVQPPPASGPAHIAELHDAAVVDVLAEEAGGDGLGVRPQRIVQHLGVRGGGSGMGKQEFRIGRCHGDATQPRGCKQPEVGTAKPERMRQPRAVARLACAPDPAALQQSLRPAAMPPRPAPQPTLLPSPVLVALSSASIWSTLRSSTSPGWKVVPQKLPARGMGWHGGAGHVVRAKCRRTVHSRLVQRHD